MTKFPTHSFLEEVTPGCYDVVWMGEVVGRLFQASTGMWMATIATSIAAQTVRIDAGEHSFQTFTDALKALGSPTLKRLGRDRKPSK
jgi:hypothetical protein